MRGPKDKTNRNQNNRFGESSCERKINPSANPYFKFKPFVYQPLPPLLHPPPKQRNFSFPLFLLGMDEGVVIQLHYKAVSMLYFIVIYVNPSLTVKTFNSLYKYIYQLPLILTALFRVG